MWKWGYPVWKLIKTFNSSFSETTQRNLLRFLMHILVNRIPIKVVYLAKLLEKVLLVEIVKSYFEARKLKREMSLIMGY